MRPFPDVESGKWQVSTAGGDAPVWAHSGKELFFRSAANEMMVAPVTLTATGFAVADRRVLFKIDPANVGTANYTPWDISPDDQRFMMMRSLAASRPSENSNLILVTNWFEELRATTRK